MCQSRAAYNHRKDTTKVETRSLQLFIEKQTKQKVSKRLIDIFMTFTKYPKYFEIYHITYSINI